MDSAMYFCISDPHIKVSGKRDNVKEAKEKIMSVLDTKVSQIGWFIIDTTLCNTKKPPKKIFLGHFWHLRWWNLKILRGTIYEELDIKSFSYSCRMNHVLWGEKKTNASAHCLIPLFDFKFTMNPILTTLVFLYVWAKSSSALHFFLLWEVISIKFT